VHKLLIHKEAIISNFSIPIEHLSEENEAQNKEFRKYRRTRKINRIKTNEDILRHLLSFIP